MSMLDPSHTSPTSRREILTAIPLLLAVALGLLLLTNTFDLFRHDLWLDEVITWLIANDASIPHALGAIRSGVETNPPTFYLLLWPIAKLSGGLNEIGLRVFSFLSILIAIAGAYLLCRRFFGLLASAVGALALLAHPLVIEQAFEARFYAPWLAATVWLALLMIAAHRSESRVETAVRCVVAVLAATLHWFGVIAVGLMLVGDVLISLRLRKEKLGDLILRAAAPLCGLAVAAACLPFFLGQRAGLTVPTWIEPATRTEVRNLCITLFGAPSVVLVVLVAWLGFVTRRSVNVSAETRSPGLLLPISVLILFPFVILLFSLLVQPALKERYVIVAVLPLAPLTAWLLRDARPICCAFALAGLVGISSLELLERAASMRTLNRAVAETAGAIDSASGQISRSDAVRTVFKRRLELYALVRSRPDLIRRAAILTFEDGDAQAISSVSRYERDMSRKMARCYPIGPLVSEKELRNAGPFVAVVAPVDGAEMRQMLPGYRVQRVGERVYIVTPPSPGG